MALRNGAVNQDVASLACERRQRPMFPVDADSAFVPGAVVGAVVPVLISAGSSEYGEISH
ncbi:hypothetical protein SJ05684_b52090 (plasmid) [Sinorhizobium sojae CCBAU 05684]|uniref:Uncharacterized protein n=1 Tax=Sinorhizobium sojae CCBAU 05684 TaxID=716928 RepID=A0A249PJV2_9HYPH|nr:hypothetical protein SJ05684_b52090 [Sinorhizobium sojae CCBAU 05684]